MNKAIDFYVSCEGETERWYLEWLQRQINEDNRLKQSINFKFKNIMPSSFSKSNNGTFTKEMISKSSYCRIQDIEDYTPCHIEKLKNLCKSTKEAKKIFPKYNFYIGYSNYTFEVWMLSHKMKVPSINDRSNYYKNINKTFNKNFIDNDDYKHEKNFKSILANLTLNDVINRAIPECERIVAFNESNQQSLKRQYSGFEYFLVNPDINLHIFIKKVLQTSGII